MRSAKGMDYRAADARKKKSEFRWLLLRPRKFPSCEFSGLGF